MSNEMVRKGYGRIYVHDEKNIKEVKKIIKELDEFEYDYLPDGFIAPFSSYPEVVYTHKFCDLDMDKLTAVCWGRGIFIWVFNSHHEEFPVNFLNTTR